MKTYKLENLSCAHCAATIEETLAGLESVRSVRLQFATLDLHLDATNLDEVKRVIDRIEPGVRIVDLAQEAAVTSSDSGRPGWWLLVPTMVLLGLLVSEAEGWFTGWPVDLAYALIYLIAGWSVLKSAGLNLVRGRVFDENFLMGVATLAAWIIGAGAEAASVMVFYQWGEWLQDRAVNRSRRSLSALLASRPRTVRVLCGDEVQNQDPSTVPTGSVFEVRAGEQVPLDGVVLEGHGNLDTSALTGESLPGAVQPGSEISAGVLNLDGLLRLKSLRRFDETVWAGIVASVDRALANKAPLERFITRFARIYTPLVLLLAGLLFAVLMIAGLSWQDSLYRSLVLLVISCPCALVVSIPLTYLGSIGAASRKGLLIRDAGALDRLAKVNAAAFDKTGTLTSGRPGIKELVPAGNEADLQDCLGAGFAASSHPLAQAWKGSSPSPQEAVEVRGQGVTFQWKGLRAGIGRRSFLEAQGFPGLPPGEDRATTVHAASESGYLGRVDFEDLAKVDTGKALEDLRSLGLKPLALLSGDVVSVVQEWGRKWNFEEIQGGLLPEEKLTFVEKWEQAGHQVLFVGDGMNDAPVLARSTVGISLGAGASAAAIETADIAVLDSSPLQIGRLVRLGRRTRILLYQNIGLALGLKALFMILGGMGVAGLWEAVFADVGVALLAVANSLRAGKDLA